MKKKKIDKIIVVIGVIEIAESILSWISFISRESNLCVLIFLLQQLMCLDIPPIANDILRITMIFSLAKSILYFSCSVKKKKKKNHIFSDFLGRFLLNIDDCLF